MRKKENNGRMRDPELGMRESRKPGAILTGNHSESIAQATENAVQQTHSLTTPGRNSSARVGHTCTLRPPDLPPVVRGWWRVGGERWMGRVGRKE
jgi:hypothetical protein